ncbi:hypothetical protein VNO77_17287 [Canavalia gladiata]|uniref:BHLH domain-containing protein n=1 Tax=Canavalia gladiata TaxID=3824 RepID=A0AAN9QJ87_CANGL
MDEPPNKLRLQSMLQASVQSVQWTYSLFWQLCPQQRFTYWNIWINKFEVDGFLIRILRWGDGYYNGSIKTRKTVQAIEISTEEASFQRSEQLRELYESLSCGDTNPQVRRPSASLSPEDLTESEWFYLLCVSFSFHPGVGLPGTAYARRQHLWLTGANEADSKTFSRAILAKTVVCIPVLEGVVELGTTDKVEEDLNFIQHIKRFFIDEHPPIMAKAALSELSTSNPTSSYLSNVPNQFDDQINVVNHENGEAKLDSETETQVRNGFQRSQLMELDTLVGSTEDGSNHSEESMALCSVGLELLQLQLLPSVHLPSENIAEGETNIHYSQTVSTILEKNSEWWPELHSAGHVTNSFQSAFNKWSTTVDDHHDHHFHVTMDNVTSQWLLKYILFSVPYLHANRIKGTEAPPYETSHVIAERRRREKLNERFLILRSMVPFVTKMDKASILGDTIEYIKQLREKIENLEARDRHMKKRRVREVEVSIIESDALLELECVHREGLLLDVIKVLREMGIEVITVQSLVNDDGMLVAEIRAKVKEHANEKRVSIVEVKKALSQIIPHHESYALASNDHLTMRLDLGCIHQRDETGI